MIEIYRSKSYSPEYVVRVYARLVSGDSVSRWRAHAVVRVYEVNARSQTIRETDHHISQFPIAEQRKIRNNNTVHQVQISKVPA